MVSELPGATESPRGRAAGCLAFDHDCPGTGQDSRRVLVAEDNPVCRVLIMRQLASLGYRADAVGDGEGVLTALARRAYGLILMDFNIPHIYVYASTKHIR